MGVSAIENTNKCSNNLLQQALAKHEAEIAEGIQESKNQYRKIVKAGISQWVKDFQKGLVKVNTVDDLKKLIELDIDLQKDDS
jgi:hypothetical protein